MGDVSSAKVGLCFSRLLFHGYHVEHAGTLEIYAGYRYITHPEKHPMRYRRTGTPQVQELAAHQEAEMRALEVLSATLRHWREYT